MDKIFPVIAGTLVGGVAVAVLRKLLAQKSPARSNTLDSRPEKADARYANVPAKVRQAIERGQKIDAIRFYRESTGVGLKEAKEYIEETMRR
ncbi:MAG: hypothetical protein ABSG69_05905 [Candidatus Acidiferrum sp.]|jgi:ribosomal protein L7/L12